LRLIDYSLEVSDLRDDHKFLVFADIHEGAAGVDYDLLKEDISEVHNEENCRAFYLGDGADAIRHDDKRYDLSSIHPWYIDPDNTERLDDIAKYQSRRICAVFNGIRDKMICGLKGNHGASHAKKYGYDPDFELAEAMGWLDKDKPIKYSTGVIILRLTFKDKERSSRPFIFAMQHHCGGGSASVQNNINWMIRTMGSTWSNADVFLTGHVHKRGHRRVSRIRLTTEGQLETKSDYQHYGVTGSYLRTYVDSVSNYGEGRYVPADLGALRVVVNPFSEDIHCY
jgi:hypothetical protein